MEDVWINQFLPSMFSRYPDFTQAKWLATSRLHIYNYFTSTHKLTCSFLFYMKADIICFYFCAVYHNTNRLMLKSELCLEKKLNRCTWHLYAYLHVLYFHEALFAWRSGSWVYSPCYKSIKTLHDYDHFTSIGELKYKKKRK